MRHRSPVWSKVRRVAQILFLLGWLVLWVSTAGLEWGTRTAKFPAEIDPLLALAQAIASRTLTAGMLLALIVVVLTMIFGRVWCGWICPVGTFLDFFPFRRIKKPHLPESLRVLKYLILTAILVAALFGNLSLLILDPITIWVRTLTWGAGPALNAAFTAAENALGMIPWLSGTLTWLDGVLRPAVFPVQIVGSRLVWLPVSLFSLLILLNLISERFWCRYLCPLGGLLALLSKVALFKRRVKVECVSCGKCGTVCPTETIDPKRGFASDTAECTMCMDCLEVCSPSAIAFQPGAGLTSKMPYDPGRRQVLITGIVTLAGLALIDTRSNKNTFGSYLLRPPGVEDNDLLQKCLRCGLCMRACPTGAIQSSLSESGFEGMFTPVLIPRLGYCLYSCNQCGQVCPVGAIPALPLAEKQVAVIGHAFIDPNRCIPWADGITCIVCEEMCPLPEKAITLEDKAIIRADGSTGVLRLPRVIRDRCIGCGICEYKCPRSGEAAIRVYRTDI